MRGTRRFWAAAGIGLALVGLAVLADRPGPLVGAAGLGAWLLAHQYRFARSLERALDDLDLEQTLDRERARIETPVGYRLAAAIDRGSPLPFRIEPRLPVAARLDDGNLALDLEVGATAADRSATLEWAVPGRYRLPPPRLLAGDPVGLFVESLDRGPTAEIAIEPRTPRSVHVGAGGTPLAGAYGEHPARGFGEGLEPEELREYHPGDPANRIDWKATARLGEAHVRDYDPETDRRTVLVVDHRASTATGLPGETVLEYLRLVALGLLGHARSIGDPVGLLTVGEADLTRWHPPTTTAAGYDAIKRDLLDLRPAEPPAAPAPATTTSPATAARAAAALDGDDTAFARSLGPFFADRAPYLERIGENPLVAAVAAPLDRFRGRLWTVLLTDDTDRTGIFEAVKLARRGDDAVLVCLAPSALFDPGGLASLDAAYERYREFEAFRRRLDRLDRVRALEVAPGDRLAAVLAARRRSPSTTRTGRRSP